MSVRHTAWVVLWAVVFGAAGGAAAQSTLQDRLTAALRHPGLRGAQVGALVVRADDGSAVFERNADRPLIPASNMKLLTALAALEVWGPTHRFTTRVLADRAPDADGAVGWLAVVGDGDPGLTSEYWWRLAADLRRAGLRRVDGPIWLDDRAFDAQRWNPAWGEIGSRAYEAPIGALMANYGAFLVEIQPGRAAGAPARVALDPPVDFLHVSSNATTRAAGTPTKLAVDRRATPGAERVFVSGVIARSAEPTGYWRSVADPTRYAGSVLRMQLAAVGIQVTGASQPGAAPAAGVELLAFEGETLARIVHLFLKYSTNPVAEMLFKGLGRARSGEAGSWANGRVALRDSLTRLGLPLAQLEVVDGSGLARADRVAPRTLVAALQTARDAFRFGPELQAALPIANRDGTLKKRLAAAPDAVRAKTGLLDGVTGLSGYAEGPDGRLIFSVLANGYRRGDAAAMSALDDFAAALVR